MVTVPWSCRCSNGFTIDDKLERAVIVLTIKYCDLHRAPLKERPRYSGSQKRRGRTLETCGTKVWIGSNTAALKINTRNA
jgi:hypothetical protein